jgi:hypothetical protein
MDGVRITYTPRPNATPQVELDALATVYRYLLLEKGDLHDLTDCLSLKTVKYGPRKHRKGEHLKWQD